MVYFIPNSFYQLFIRAQIKVMEYVIETSTSDLDLLTLHLILNPVLTVDFYQKLKCFFFFLSTTSTVLKKIMTSNTYCNTTAMVQVFTIWPDADTLKRISNSLFNICYKVRLQMCFLFRNILYFSFNQLIFVINVYV